MKKYIALLALSFITIFMISCKNTSGEKASTADAAKVNTATGTDFGVDLATSQILWAGTKPTGTHTGTINLSDGNIIVQDGNVVGGSFTMDMNTIVNTDLEGKMKNNLEVHLKGTVEGKENDFFNITQYPTSRFEITKTTALDGDENATHLVYGNLTIRDVTKEIGFKAQLDMSTGQLTVHTPQFTINRTEWGINFRSKSVFDNLKDNFINDEIGLQINLIARAQS